MRKNQLEKPRKHSHKTSHNGFGDALNQLGNELTYGRRDINVLVTLIVLATFGLFNYRLTGWHGLFIGSATL